MVDTRISLGPAAGILRRGQETGPARQLRTGGAAAQYILLVAHIPALDRLHAQRRRMVRRHGIPHTPRHAARPYTRGTEGRDRTLVVGIRVLRHQAPAHHHRRPHQRHTSSDGAHRGSSDLRRASQRPAMDRCRSGRLFTLHAQPRRTTRGYRLRP